MNLDDLFEKSIYYIALRLSSVEDEFFSLAGETLKKIYRIPNEQIRNYLYSTEYDNDISGDINKVKKALNSAHNANLKDMNTLFNKVTATVHDEGEALGNLSPLKDYKRAVNPMLKDIVSGYKSMAKSTSINQAYKKTINNFVNRLIGDDEHINYPQAMRKAIRELTEQGITTIDYESGRKVRMDSTVRNSLMTEYTEIVEGVQHKLAEKIGTDGWEISAHEHAALDHIDVQGHIFTNEEFEKLQDHEVAVDIEGEKFQIDRAIGDWNCRHIAYPFLIGISEPSFTKEELEAIQARNEAGVEFHGKHYTLYEAEQLQRRYETEMRKEREQGNLYKQAIEADDTFSADYRKSRERLAGLRDSYKELGETLAPHAIRTKMERSYVPKLVTGGDSGGLRDKGELAQRKYSDTYYNSIRNRESKSDISAIAKGSGFTYDQVSAIREHIFIKEHNLGEGATGRFTSDYQIAQAWQRLEQGKGTELDKLLLNHELEELKLMKQFGYDYPTAHSMAQAKYPWSERLKKEEKK